VSGTVSNKLKDGKKVTNTVTWQPQQGVHRQHSRWTIRIVSGTVRNDVKKLRKTKNVRSR
jgi:Ser-tRNA(Ala) deacylase AlaX